MAIRVGLASRGAMPVGMETADCRGGGTCHEEPKLMLELPSP